MEFQFTFKFDGDKTGTKTYNGTITQCVRKFNADCKHNVLPQVENADRHQQSATSEVKIIALTTQYFFTF